MISRKLHMEGLITLTTYLYPTNDQYKFVIIEGSGRFFAVRDTSNEILLSGDFHIQPQRYSLSDFKSGCIPLDTNTYTTRIPGKPTYYKNTKVRYNLYLDTSDADNNTFSVDYRRNHPAYIDLDNDNKFNPTVKFATLKLNPRYGEAKLIDLSGLKLVKNNYKIQREAALRAAREGAIDKQRSCIVE
jgi:hypothetical protein